MTFDNAIISTGSVTKMLPGVEVSDNVVTYEEQILDQDLPESIIIVGAGAIGMEFAYVHANYGVKVTVVEFLDRVLPNEDKDVSAELAKHYKKLGVQVRTSTKVDSVKDLGDEGVVVQVSDKDGRQRGAPGREGDDLGRLRPARRGLRPRAHRRPADQGRRHRHRRPHAHHRSRTSTPSATSPPSCSWPTWPRRRAWSRPRPSPAPRRWSSATTG